MIITNSSNSLIETWLILKKLEAIHGIHINTKCHD